MSPDEEGMRFEMKDSESYSSEAVTAGFHRQMSDPDPPELKQEDTPVTEIRVEESQRAEEKLSELEQEFAEVFKD